MDSWLDWYANEVAINYKWNDIRHQHGRDDDVRHLFSSFVAECVSFMRRPGAELDDSFRGEIAWFGRCIAPFGGHFSEKPPLAIVLEHGALEGVNLREVGDDVRNRAKEVLTKHSTVYLDLPDLTHMLRPGVLQLRALFAWQSEQGNRFCAVLTRPGSKRGCRIAWLEGRHARNKKDPARDQVWAMGSDDIADPYRPINAAKINFDELEDVERLVWAALASWQHRLDNRMPLEDLPQVDSHSRQQLHLIDIDPPLCDQPDSLFSIARIRDFQFERVRAIHGSAPQVFGVAKSRHHVREFCDDFLMLAECL